MTDRLHITDHALLGWMERAYGVNVPEWREIMRGEAEAALRSGLSDDPVSCAAFAISAKGRVIDFAPKGFRKGSLVGVRPIFVPRIVAPSDLSLRT